jgi:DNA replication and repair protein RecF
MGNGIDLGDYGSRGQIRSAVLSLKLAEVAWMKERTGNWPILLLDETLAELDLNRREDLLSTLGDSEQVIMTTTDLNLFPKEFLRNCNQWRVEQGMVNPDSSTA